MEDYTLRIPKSSAKSSALLTFLKSLDFIEITKPKDWWDELTYENKASVERGLDDLNNGRVHSDEDVRNSVRQKILNASKK